MAQTTDPTTGQTIVDPVAAALMRQALTEAPMTSPWQLAGRLAQFGVGNWLNNRELDAQREESKRLLGSLPGLGVDPSTAAETGPGARPAASPAAPPARPAAAAPPSTNPNVAILNDAAKRVGVDPAYVGRIAGAESRYDPNAKSDTGALGLGQFMPATWKAYITKYGPQYGYGPDTPATDPQANALMTAHYTKDSQDAFKRRFGRDATPGELYTMHFLGQGRSTRVWGAKDQDTMDQVLPDIYASSPTNRAALSDARGQPLTVAAFKDKMQRIAGGDTTNPATGTAPNAPGIVNPGGPAKVQGTIPPDMVQWIRGALASRNPQMRALGLQMYAQFATPDKPTDEVRNYQFYARDEVNAGRTPKSFEEWRIADKKAGATNVTTNVDKGVANDDVETVKELGVQARAARGELDVIPRLRRALEAVGTGRLAGAQKTIGEWEQALGIKIVGVDPNKVAAAQELPGLLGQMISSRLAAFKPVTVFETQFVEKQVPNLLNTPAGNLAILDFLETAAKERIRDHYEAYQELNGPRKSLAGYYRNRAERSGVIQRDGEGAPPAPGIPANPPAGPGGPVRQTDLPPMNAGPGRAIPQAAPGNPSLPGQAAPPNPPGAPPAPSFTAPPRPAAAPPADAPPPPPPPRSLNGVTFIQRGYDPAAKAWRFKGDDGRIYDERGAPVQ